MPKNTPAHAGNLDGPPGDRTARKSPPLARLLRTLARLIEGKPADASWDEADNVLLADERVASPRSAEPPAPVRIDLKAVDHLLTDIHERGVKASVGKIQMVHVGAVREAFGEKWDRYAGRAMDLAEGVLRRHLDPTDLYARYENFAFIVIFSDLDEAYAQERAAAISLEIQYRLLHDPELAERVSVNSVAARIVDMLSDEVPPTLGALSRELDRKSKERQSQQQYGQPKRNKPNELPEWIGKFSPGYRPMLHTSDQTIGTYFAVQRRRLEDGTWLIDEDAYPGGRDEVVTLEMDELLGRRVVSDLRDAVVDGSGALVATMINIRSLYQTSPLFPQFHKLSNRARDQFVIEVVGVQPGTPLGLLVEIAGNLRPFSKQINLRLPLFDPEIDHLSTVGLHSIGCDLTSARLEHRRISEIAEAMEIFVERANALDFHTHFHGISTTEQFATAVRVGADYLTGDIVAPFIASPAGRLQFEQIERAFPTKSGLDGPSVSGSTTPHDVAP